MEKNTTHLLYRPQLIIEDALKEPDLVPVRLFALLFPLWRVELGGTFREQKPYALLEEYIERGIFEGQLQTIEELSAFFGIDPRLVAKVLDFLQTIEHVQDIQGRWSLTALGQESLADGQKYIPKKSHQECLFEAFQSRPLTREHYEKMQICTEQEAEEQVSAYRGYRWERPYSFHDWQAGAVDELAHRSDRDKYNLRPEISGVHQTSEAELVYLPLYLLEARKQNGQRSYLAYSRIRGRRDQFFEHIVNTDSDIRRALEAVADREQQGKNLWAPWLKKHGLTNVYPLQMPNGIWRLNLPPSLFRTENPPLAIGEIGTYHLDDGHFLFIWCEDVEIRRYAALDRALRLVERYKKTITEREVEKNLQLLSEQLATRQLDLDDLKRRASETRKVALLDVINAF